MPALHEDYYRSEHTLAYANKLAVRWPAEIVIPHCYLNTPAPFDTSAA